MPISTSDHSSLALLPYITKKKLILRYTKGSLSDKCKIIHTRLEKVVENDDFSECLGFIERNQLFV